MVTALTCLGAVAKKPLRFLDPFLSNTAPPSERQSGSLSHGSSGLVKWLESRNWERQPDFVGNEVLNVGTLLQYARDFQKDDRCRPAMRELLDWMTTHHLSDQTGLWGRLDVKNPRELSRAVQGGYHFWLLYFYDRLPIPHLERVIDSCLATQNAYGDSAKECVRARTGRAVLARTSTRSTRWCG